MDSFYPKRTHIIELISSSLENEEEPVDLLIGDTPSLYCSPGRFANLLEKDIVWRAWPEEEGYVALLTDYSRQVWIRDQKFDRFLEDS